MTNSRDIWRTFKSYSGSHGIASQNAIGGLIEVIRQRKPLKILEVGAGIGTLTYTILHTLHETFGDASAWTFYTIETNDFCIEQLKQNTKSYEGEFTRINDLAAIRQKDLRFDLMVIDGGSLDSGDTGYLELSGLLAERAAIFIEGYRQFQREQIVKWYSSRKFTYLNSLSIDRQIYYDHSDGKVEKVSNKGYWIIYFEPTMTEKLRALRLNVWRNRLMPFRRAARSLLTRKKPAPGANS